jgi:GDPmannose 4,6-dehydratase
MRKTALITGITGQDGSYLSEFLLEKGYHVHGIVRRSSSFNTDRVEHLYAASQSSDLPFFLHYGDLSDASAVNRLLEKIQPDEIYNLGAQSHVKVSFDIPEYTADVAGMGALRLLDAIKNTGIKTRYYQASSSEMFGLVQETPQRETTPFYPRSPYAVAKVFAHWMTVNYRESYGLYACNGILFNHESPRRGKTFVTSKIVDALVRYKYAHGPALRLGNLDAKRDWGFAGDYVDAMWRMLQQQVPDDYVVATGETHSVRAFLELTLHILGICAVSNGKTGLEEAYLCADTGMPVVVIDARYFRPAEVDFLMGDASKAKETLGWVPTVTFEGLVQLMVDAEIGAYTHCEQGATNPQIKRVPTPGIGPL